MDQLIEYMKKLNGSLSSYPKDMDKKEETDNDDEVEAVTQHDFTINFDSLKKSKRRIKRKIPPWWNETCEDALIDKKFARKMLKKYDEDTPERVENYKIFKEAERSFRKITKKAKKDFYNKVKYEIERCR